MAQTTIAVDDPLAVKVYSAKLQKSVPKDSWFLQSGFVGEDPSKNVIVKKTDLTGKFGDLITFGIRQSIRGYTTPGDNPLKGKEHPLIYLDDRVAINQQRTGVNSGGKMTNKRVPYKTLDDAKEVQSEYWGVRLDEEFIGKLSGTLGVGDWENINPNVSGFDVEGAIDSDGNSLRAPSSNRHIIASSDGTKGALTIANKFSLDVVDKALLQVTRLQKAGTTRRKMVPLRIGGKKVWVCLLDLVQAFDLKAATGGRWYDIEKARLQGAFKDSALVQQSLGVYESAAGSVVFHSHEGMVKFNDYGNGGNVEAARALLMGQAAGVFAPGENMGNEPGLYANWHQEEDDRGNQVVVTSGLIYGIQKCAYRTEKGAADSSREDFGVCVIDTAAAWS